MKKTFTLLIAALLCCVGVVKAAVTDLPEMSTNGDIKCYTISNTRSASGKYLFWSEAGVKDANSLTAASLFYFTGTQDACYIHNAKTELLFSGAGTWTEAGKACKLSVSPLGTGLMIGFDGTFLNEQNYDNGFTTWYDVNDAGSVFVFEEVTDFSAIIDALKEAAQADLDKLAKISVLFSDATQAKAKVDAVKAAGTSLSEFIAAAEAIEAIVAAYKKQADNKYVRFTTKGRNTTDGHDLTASKDGGIGTTNSADAGIWTITCNNDGTFKLYNFVSNLYLGVTQGTSQRVTTCADFADAGSYVFNVKEENTVNLLNNNNTLHLDGSGNIVQWNDNNAGASIWEIVSCAPIAITRERYDAALTAKETLPYALQQAYGLVTDAAKYTSNAKQDGEGSYEALLDNTYSTYFHSSWGAVIGDYHYLQAEVSEKVKDFYFYFKKRDTNNNNRPIEIEILGSIDGTEFTPITTINTGLPTDGSQIDYFSGTISAEEDVKYIRFVIKATNSGQLDNQFYNEPKPEGKPFFTFSEFYIFSAEGDVENLHTAYKNIATTSITDEAINNYADILIKAEEKLALADIKKAIAAALSLHANNHAVIPSLGQYTTATYEALADEYNNPDATRASLETALSNFNSSQNRPVYFITSAWSTGYSAGSAIYYDGNWKWAKADVYNKKMWMTIPGYTQESFPAVSSYDPEGASYQICDYLTNTVMRGKSVQIVAIDGWEGAYNLQYNADASNTDAVQHAADYGALVNWKAATTQENQASAWYIEYLGTSYDLEQLTGEYKIIIPSAYAQGTPYAEFEKHVVDNQLTIYTSYCHWSNDLNINQRPYLGQFYSNEQSYAIKSIQFVTNNVNESLIVSGSNDGENWFVVDEVNVASGKGVADFSGTAYNFFKVATKGNQKVQISNMLIVYDPSVELPIIVDEPAFNSVGGSLYEPIRLQLSSEEGAAIYWSTDGQEYEKYTHEIQIDSTCTIYAYAEIDGAKSKVIAKNFVVAKEYENIGAMLAAVEATEEGTPVIINLNAAITKLGKKQVTINDNTGELLLSDNNLPDYYALKDTLGGKLRGEYKLVKGVATMCNLDKAYLTYIKHVPSEAPALAGQYFTVGKPAAALNTNTWYVLKNVGRKAYVNEADNGLKMVDPANYTSRMAADEHQGVLFHFVKSENDSQYYNIVSGKGHYFSLGNNTATVSTTAVDFIVDKISGNTYYMQDQSTTYVADGQNAGQNFVGWGSTIPTSTTGNNAYQFLEVEFIDGSKLESQAKAASLHYELQQAYGLVTSASQFSSNAVEPTEGSLANLLDNDYTTFFHSTWSAAVEDTHYLQAEVSQPAKSFFFYFKKRSQNDANRPTNITILGSNDGTEFTEITTIKSGLPTDAAVKDYTSSVINAATAYKHIRFVVNATNNGAKEANGNQFFTFSEFYIFPNNSTIVNALNAANALLAVDIDNKNFEKLQAAFEAAYEKVNAAKYKAQFDEAIAEANALFTAAKHAEKPALGEYSTAAYNTFKSTISELKKATPSENSINAIREAIKAFTKAKCLPVFTIDGVIDYADGKSIYEAADGQLYFKTTDENDTTMLWTFDMTVKKVGVTEAVTVRNMATGNLFWGSQSIRVTETSDANEEDEIFLFYTENNNIPVHAQNDLSKIVRWNSTESTSGSAWVFTYVGTTYDLDDLFEDDPEVPETPTDPEDPEVDPEDPEDNPETGINSAENCDKPIVVYTITGKAIQTTVGKLQNLEKGIYIIDGKKKMVK